MDPWLAATVAALVIGGVEDYARRRVHLILAHVAAGASLAYLAHASLLYAAYGAILLAMLSLSMGYVDAAATLASIVVALRFGLVGMVMLAGVWGWALIQALLEGGRIPWWPFCALSAILTLLLGWAGYPPG